MNEHFFSAHTSARLTFVVGVVLGMSMMTLGGAILFGYIFFGGEVGSYSIAPLDANTGLLTEPLQVISTAAAGQIAEPTTQPSYGAADNYTVTLVQYVDYECRFCKKFFPEILQLVDSHPDQVRFVLKHFPLVQIHPHAKAAAVAAYCAGEQGQLFDYSSRLFASQTELPNDIYTTVAETLQLDLVAFAACVDAPAALQQIEADTQEALNLGIQSQPNLVLWRNDGSLELIDGYVSASYLESVLGDVLR